MVRHPKIVALLVLLGPLVALLAVAEQAEKCPESSLLVWREKSVVNKFFLAQDKVSCIFSICEFNSSKEESQGTSEAISFQVQNHDAMELLFSLDSSVVQNTQKVVLESLQEFQLHSCDHENSTDGHLWSKTADQQLLIGPEILTPGFHFLRVQLISLNSTCSLAWNLNVTVYDSECIKSPGEPICSAKGSCVLKPGQMTYSCQCCSGLTGRYCEERDGCFGNPCKNEGFCVDITEGLSGTMYQCLCKHGFQGRTCEERLTLCSSKPCQNNGTCVGNDTSYKCHCPKGYSGANCEIHINQCLSKPCVQGICEETEGTYKCYCRPGYGGDKCEFEYDECDSNPCINGGACEDLVAGYRCHCGPGYRGRRCEIKVDLCRPNPCVPPAQCTDMGNNYTCSCHPHANGPGCTVTYDPCFPIPCQNGGSCWPSGENFYCSCTAQFTGETCEDVLFPPQQSMSHVRHEPLQQQPDDEKEHLKNLGGIPIDHLHNIYIAAATLAGACLIVIAVVTICHCRVHKTYQRFARRFSRSCSELKQKTLPRQILAEPLWERF